ncbi:MAG: hypothetical protein DPW16_12055 [Chloroflexi bacterium]|nr:hypothetical protein [Chloroflexota bacterium]
MKTRQIFVTAVSLMFIFQSVPKNLAFDDFRYHEILRIGRGSVESLNWNPTGEILAVADGLGVRLYGLDDNISVELTTTGRAVSVYWNSEGNKLAVGDSKGALTIWNYPALEVIADFENPLTEAVKLVSWSPDGKFLAVSYFGSYHDYIIIWNTEDFGIVSTLEIDEEIYRVSSLTWNPIGSQIASGDSEGRIVIWDTLSGEVSSILESDTGIVDALAWSPDNQRIAVSGNGRTYIWDLEVGEISAKQNLQTPWVILLSWASNSILNSITNNYAVYEWDVVGDQPTVIFELENQNYVYIEAKAAWNEKTGFLAIAKEDKVDVFDTNSKIILKTFEGNNSPPVEVVWSPDGEFLASINLYENIVRIWNSSTGELIHTLESANVLYVEMLAWSLNRKLSASSTDGVIEIWDFSEAKPSILSTINQPSPRILFVSWSPDNQRLMEVGGVDTSRTVFIWEVEGGQLLTSLQGDTTRVSTALWSPTGERIATATYEGDIQIWDAKSYEPLPTSLPHEKNHFYPTDRFIWSPDGRNLAGVSCNQPLRECYLWIWNISTDELSTPFQGISEEGIESLAWSPEGTFIASATEDKVEIWDSQTGKLLGTIDSFGDDVTSVSWSPVDNMFATASLDGTIRIWAIE